MRAPDSLLPGSVQQYGAIVPSLPLCRARLLPAQPERFWWIEHEPASRQSLSKKELPALDGQALAALFI
jgi:hypothetical protein